ncbi:MAG: PAS domain S-box protein [Myxococcales bacterium]|nr:PAS domain S-box protein [Myxococcales bacterium]
MGASEKNVRLETLIGERDKLRARLDSLLQEAAERVWCYEYHPPIRLDAPLDEQMERFFNGVLVECNEATARLYGAVSTDEVIGRTLIEKNQQHHERIRRLFLSFAKSNYQLVDALSEDLAPDGSRRLYTTNAHATIIDGAMVRVWGRTRDITALLRTRQALDESRTALRDSESMFRALVENLDEVVYSLARDGILEYVSPVIERRFDMHPSDVLGKSIFDLVHPDDRDKFRENFERVLAGNSEALEFRGYDLHGKLHYLRARSSPRVRDGEVVGVDGVVLDLTEAKHAEEAERERWRAHRVLLGNLPGMAYRCSNDSAWTMQIISDGCRALLGYDPRDLVDGAELSYRELIVAEDRDFVRRAIDEAISERRAFTIEYRVHTASGDIKWVWEKGTPVSGEQGDIEALEGLITDITQRKHSAERAHLYNEHLLQVTAVLQQLAVTRDVDDIAAIVSAALRDVSDADGATFVLRDGEMADYAHVVVGDESRRGGRKPLDASLSGHVILTKRPLVIEDMASAPPPRCEEGGAVKSLVIAPVRVEAPIGAVGCWWSRPQKITSEQTQLAQALADAAAVAIENVRSMGELESSRARMQALYDHLPTATLLWRREGEHFVLESFNEKAREMGAGDSLRVGEPASVMSARFPELEPVLARCFERKLSIRREVEALLSREQVPRNLVVHYGYVPQDVVAMHIEDVTAQHQVQQQLKASQRLEAVARLAGGIAHDFNNLLSVIINYAELASMALREADPVRADLDAIMEAGQRAARLTRQLLAFSRKQVQELAVVNVNDIVNGIGAMLTRMLGEDIHIDLVLDEQLGRVEADPAQLEQVLMNLAVNARDAMPRGGTMTIETRNVRLEHGLGEVPAGRYVALSVSDTGVGMDSETREHLFEPFFTTKTIDKGTGLGLSTVYGIVKQSGGGITVESTLGRGSRFDVYLPQADELPLEAPAAPRDSAPMLGRETILLVEDEEGVRRITERILRAAGYRVLVAANGGEALMLCEEHGVEIDLMLTDVVMPRVSGREVAERARGVVPGLPVLYMSGYTDDAIVRHGVGRDTSFLSKPFDAGTLTRKVREVLDKA